jgi:catechol 2,3-dioxygenase-like lactoylglutathione lyase family enzyme
MSAKHIEFNHGMIYITQLEPSLAFYRDVLGFELIETYPGAYARMRSPQGTTSIALHVLDGDRQLNAKLEGMRLYFEVKELDAFCNTLQEQGVKFIQMPKDMPWGWRHAYLADPDGHEISLYWAGDKRLKPTVMS